jgi:DNA-binding transcriptional MocR family regulator
MTTKTELVMTAIRSRIASGVLAADDRLPSIRQFALAVSVSPSTVVDAYDRLAAEGLIRARRGSGFYVAPHRPAHPTPMQSTRARDVDPFWVSRESLDAAPGVAMPGCGWLPADWMPVESLRRAVRALARADARTLVDYGGARGALILRRVVAARLTDEGIDASPDQVLLTASGTSALDLVCRSVLKSGDVVLVDDPCYFNFRALLRAHGAEVVGVPYTASGPDIAAFEAVLVAKRPRLYLTNSGLHNPTGATLSPQTAHRVLRAAAAHGVTIVEDDIFSDFEPDRSARLATLDGLDRVIRVGSFSKTLSASLRCGYIAARPAWIEGLVDLQVATGFSGPGPAITGVVAHVLAGGGYRKHLDDVRARLARARRDAARKLHALGVEPWLMPRGGFYLWCRLPTGLDSALVARRARQEDVVLAPGNVFSVTQTASGFMRFNVAQCGSPQTWDVLARSLEDVARDATSRVPRAA